MESENYALAIDQENIGRVVQYHLNGWRIGTLASVGTENVQVKPITGGLEKTIRRDDVRLVIREAEKPKANRPELGKPELPTHSKPAKVSRPKAAKKAKAKMAHGRFNLRAAFEKARKHMKTPDRKKCKHGHPICAENACVADLKRMGRYCCDPCIKLYAARAKKATKPKTRKPYTLFEKGFGKKAKAGAA